MMAKRQITIVGMGPSATERRWDLYRYIPAGAEVWGLNNGYLNYSHCLGLFTRWFELHRFDYLKRWDVEQSGATKIGAADHFAALDRIGCPVYTSEALPRVSRQVRVDWTAVFAHHIGGQGSNYFLGSPSLMLALALWEHDRGATIGRIDSWGIDTSDPQHAQQRASWAYWVSQCHARQIETGGTATAFMTETERDGGLVGMREKIGDAVAASTQAPGSTDYVIVSMATDNEPYRTHAATLRARCAEIGVACDVRLFPAAADWQAGIAAVRRGFTETIREALARHNKPVVYMDVDDRLLKLPTLPADLDGAGLIANPEADHYKDAPCLPASCISAWTPTDKGRACLDIVAGVEKAISYHRGVNALWAAGLRWKGSGVQDITSHFRGCIEITPHRGRTTLCRT